MGALYAFDLQPFIDKYGLRCYYETGTGEGISFRHALKYDFDIYATVDIDYDLGKALVDQLIKEYDSKFREKILVYNDTSKKAIAQWGEVWKLPEYNFPSMFFLDAHFPGADFHKISYEESLRTYMKDAFPLEDELRLIKELRDTSKDVIIIDDFILYEDGDYDTIREGVTWNYGWLQDELGLQTNSQFIYDLFGETHNFTKDTRHQGYLILTPKD